MSTMVRGYTTCVTAVGADMVNVTPLGGAAANTPEWLPGAMWVEIRVGRQAARIPWTTGPLPAIGTTVTINIEQP